MYGYKFVWSVVSIKIFFLKYFEENVVFAIYSENQMRLFDCISTKNIFQMNNRSLES